jgi:hypothetical protein
MRRTEFARCGTSGFRQAPQCFIATLGAFEDFAGDVPPCHMLLAAVRKDLTCPFEGDFHVGQGPSLKTSYDHGCLLYLGCCDAEAIHQPGKVGRNLRGLTSSPFAAHPL